MEDLPLIQNLQRRGFTLRAIFEKYQDEGYTVTFSAFNKALSIARHPEKHKRLAQGPLPNSNKPAPAAHTTNTAPTKATPAPTDYFQRPNVFGRKK